MRHFRMCRDAIFLFLPRRRVYRDRNSNNTKLGIWLTLHGRGLGNCSASLRSLCFRAQKPVGNEC